MSTPFLLGYAAALVEALLHDGSIEIEPGQESAVVAFVARDLEVRGKGGSLISCTSRALLACPQVVELYVDDQELKEVVEHLRSRPSRGASVG